MKIRPATLDDAEIISNLNSVVQRVHAQALPHLFKPPSSQIFPPALVREILTDPDNYIFIAFSNDSPAGYVYARMILQDETSFRYSLQRCYIHHLAVEQSCQGLGIGKALIQSVAKLAQEKGVMTLMLDVWSANEKARAFFVRQGFTVFNEKMSLSLG